MTREDENRAAGQEGQPWIVLISYELIETRVRLSYDGDARAPHGLITPSRPHGHSSSFSKKVVNLFM
jgi:hypothetical protein